MTVLLRTEAPKAGETAAQLAAVAGAEESAAGGTEVTRMEGISNLGIF